MAVFTKPGFTFDDVLLVPQYSDLSSRAEADTSTKVGELSLKIPIFSANMDTITGPCMAKTMHEAGGLGILHRYIPQERILHDILNLLKQGVVVIPSVGVQSEDRVYAQKYRAYTNHICLDIAHGDSKSAVEMIQFLKKLDYKTIIAGNVATWSGAVRLAEAGANVIKVGIGPGSVCTTRSVTGHGVPQLTAIIDVANSVKNTGVHIIADGGFKNSGDIVKALAAGADAIMTGSLFASCHEITYPGVYRGMASAEAQHAAGKKPNNPEGVAAIVQTVESAFAVMDRLAAGIRSGMSYSGARTLQELRTHAMFMPVSTNTVVENGVRHEVVSRRP